MSRPSKGTRLVWRKESYKADGSIRSKAGWYIEDGGKRISTGFGRAERDDAEKALALYIAKKYTPERERDRHPDNVKVADVVRVYNRDVVPNQSRPKETASRLVPIIAFFGETALSEINGQLCRDYVAQAPTVSAARRQLEDLRAAIRHYHAEGYVTTIPVIVMPDKPEARIRWLTRQEAAKLLRAAWRMRQTWKGRESDRRTGRHVARFILAGLYTGTRSSAICGAALRPTEGRGFVDLDRGVFYRKGQGLKETKKRQPAVRIPDRLLAHMRRWSRTPVSVKTETRGKSQTAGRFVSHDYVVEWNGAPVGSVKKAFKAACEAAGLGWYEDGVFKTDVTPHVLRHTAATWLMQNGSTLTEAADYLGMTEQVLRDVYYHHHPDFQAEAAARITAKQPILRSGSNVVRMR